MFSVHIKAIATCTQSSTQLSRTVNTHKVLLAMLQSLSVEGDNILLGQFAVHTVFVLRGQITVHMCANLYQNLNTTVQPLISHPM